MTVNEKRNESKLQRVTIECNTCGVSDSFYSSISLNRFKLKHTGHLVVEAGQPEPPSDPLHGNTAPVEERGPPDPAGATRVSRVVVDLVVFPALPEPVFRVRGFNNSVELAFVVTSSSDSGAKVRELLESGRYTDHGFSEVPYVWAPQAIEYEEDARVKLRIPASQPKRMLSAGPQPGLPLEKEVEPTVAKTSYIPDLHSDQERESRDTVFPTSHSAAVRQDFESLTRTSRPLRPKVDEAAYGPDEISLHPPVQPSLPDAAGSPMAKGTLERANSGEQKLVESSPSHAPVGVSPPEAETQGPPPNHQDKEEEGSLLVSKSWYIQGGTKNRKEALRISKVLSEFRWVVEPIYTIGVMVEDIVSIETSKEQIGRSLIRRIETIGYRLTAVTSEKGKPVAWFKLKPSPDVAEAASDNETASADTRSPPAIRATSSMSVERVIAPPLVRENKSEARPQGPTGSTSREDAALLSAIGEKQEDLNKLIQWYIVKSNALEGQPADAPRARKELSR